MGTRRYHALFNRQIENSLIPNKGLGLAEIVRAFQLSTIINQVDLKQFDQLSPVTVTVKASCLQFTMTTCQRKEMPRGFCPCYSWCAARVFIHIKRGTIGISINHKPFINNKVYHGETSKSNRYLVYCPC